MPTEIKSMSKMNKKELFDYCKNQRSQIQSHQMDMNELKEENKQMKSDIEELKEHPPIYEKELGVLREKIKKLKEKNKDLESGNLCMEEENEKLTGMIDWNLIKDNKKLQSDIQELLEKNKNLESEYEELNGEYEEVKSKKWEKHLKLTDGEITNCYKTIKKLESSSIKTKSNNKILKSKLEKLESENKYLKENLEFNNNYKKSCEKRIKELESKLYKFDPETGEMKGTIIDSYKTPNYYYWRNTNLQEQIAYECNDDDSMFELNHYIKFLEISHMKS